MACTLWLKRSPSLRWFYGAPLEVVVALVGAVGYVDGEDMVKVCDVVERGADDVVE